MIWSLPSFFIQRASTQSASITSKNNVINRQCRIKMVLHLQLQDFFTDLFVGNVYSKESIEECLFITSRNLVTNSECATGIFSWLLPLFTLISKVLEPIAAHIPPTWTPSTTSLIWSLSVLLHTITSFAFQKSSQLITCKGPKAGISFIYAFNPIILLSCALSPAPSLLHLLIVLAHYSATRGWSIVLFICLTLLVTGHSELYCVIPAYLVLLRASKNKLRINGVVSKSNDNATCLIKLILVLLFTAFAAFLLRQFSTTSLQKGLHTNSSLSLHSAWADWLTRGMGRYHPAAGVFWYLDAQVFDQYSEYFFLLVNVQPLLFVVPLLLRLSHSKPLHTV